MMAAELVDYDEALRPLPLLPSRGWNEQQTVSQTQHRVHNNVSQLIFNLYAVQGHFLNDFILFCTIVYSRADCLLFY